MASSSLCSDWSQPRDHMEAAGRRTGGVYPDVALAQHNFALPLAASFRLSAARQKRTLHSPPSVDRYAGAAAVEQALLHDHLC